MNIKILPEIIENAENRNKMDAHPRVAFSITGIKNGKRFSKNNS